MKIITIANQKGGIGKTTSATALAYTLNQWGYKTLLIDADEQCNSTDAYRAQTEGVATLYDLILDDDPCTLEEAIQHTEYGDIIAGDAGLITGEKILTGEDSYFRLRDHLSDLKGYKYVIVDTHPSVNNVLYNCLAASDSVVIPITADRYSIQGLSMLTDTIYEAKGKLNPQLKIAGLLLCMFDERLNLNKDFLIDIPGVAKQIGTKVFKSRIRYTVKCREAQTVRMPLGAYAPRCNAQKDYEDFARELTGIRKGGK